MTEKSAPVIRVTVDVTNPGQFFACCGLMELAERTTTKGVEGWFTCDHFCLRGPTSVISLMCALVKTTPESIREPAPGVRAEESIAPITLRLGSKPLILDAWIKWGIEKRKPKISADSSWKFWSGNQSVSKIWRELSKDLDGQLRRGEFVEDANLLTAKVYKKGRFGFDAQAAWNALDAGYSPNDQNQPVATRPALELLALIGLQRFRPAVLEDFQFEYSTWGVPLAPVSARVAASGLLTIPPATRFRAKIIRRGKYGGLSYATSVSGDPA